MEDLIGSHVLYDFGYNSGFKIEELVAFAEDRDVLIADIRYSPRARNPQWRKEYLEKVLGARYMQLGHWLGNSNYKGNTIQIVDVAQGCKQLLELLKKSNVAIMCACWNFNECHRKEVVEQMAFRYTIKSAWLSKDMVREVANLRKPLPPEQLGLFP